MSANDRNRASSPASTKREEQESVCAGLKAGDEAAFRALVSRHHASMVRFAMGFVHTRASAEEVVQETWLAVLDGLEGFEGRSSLTTWIYSILANKARTKGVRDARSVSFSELAAEGSGPAVDPSRFDSAGMWVDPPRIWDSLNPERIVAGKQLCVHLTQILDKLPPMQRAVITLQDIEGQEANVVCTLLQLTDANRRVLLHRARSKVRQELEMIVGTGKPQSRRNSPQ